MPRFWAPSGGPAPRETRADRALDEAFLRRLERLELTARTLQASHARGQRVARRVGVGIEFAEHRPYSSGDDLRFVDFAAYARSDRLLVKQFVETQDLEVHILLDCSASMGFGDGRKLAHAKQLAAAVGYVALANLDRVSIQTYAEQLRARLAAMRGKSRTLALLRFLEEQRAHGLTRLADCARQFVARESRRGLVVVVTDGFDREGLLPGIDALRFARFTPVVLLVRDPREIERIPHGAWRLVDEETGEQRDAELSGRALLAQQARENAHFTWLRSQLRDRQISSFELSVERPFDSALIDVLRRGGLFS